MPNGINYAANLPAYDSKDLQAVFGTMVSEYIVSVYKRSLNMNLVLNIDSDVELCRTITYLCEDASFSQGIDDSAVDGAIKERTVSAPKVKTFSGFCKGGIRFKIPTEQLECINQNSFLKNWFNSQLMNAIEAGRRSIMSRFFRELMIHAHPRNSGNNAGLLSGGNVLGTISSPVVFNSANADKFIMAMRNVISEMPKGVAGMGSMLGSMDTPAYFFGPTNMEGVLMQTDAYNKDSGFCPDASCSMFRDMFDLTPRGFMPLTGSCIESYKCQSAGEDKIVYPVLFGKRYMGAKASLRIKTYNWMSNDQQSVFYQTVFYHHIHVYNPCYIGLGYITIENDQPEVIAACN